MIMQKFTTKLHYDGHIGELYKIWLTNLLLKIVTLGIYRFWAKTRIRHYIIGHFTLLGDRCEYSGTSKELLKGFVRKLPLFILLLIPYLLLPSNLADVIMFVPFFCLIHAGLFAAKRYQLSRISWRGIHGRLTGSAFHYSMLRLGLAFLNMITLGLLIPYSDMKIQAYLCNHSYVGTSKISFTGKAMPLVPIHLITLLLALPSLGFSRFWYRAALSRHVYASMHMGSIGFLSARTGTNLCRLVSGNLVLFIVTLGFGLPLIMQRNLHYYAKMLTITNDGSSVSILQSDQALTTSGEGLNSIVGDDASDIGLEF